MALHALQARQQWQRPHLDSTVDLQQQQKFLKKIS